MFCTADAFSILDYIKGCCNTISTAVRKNMYSDESWRNKSAHKKDIRTYPYRCFVFYCLEGPLKSTTKMRLPLTRLKGKPVIPEKRPRKAYSEVEVRNSIRYIHQNQSKWSRMVLHININLEQQQWSHDHCFLLHTTIYRTINYRAEWRHKKITLSTNIPQQVSSKAEWAASFLFCSTGCKIALAWHYCTYLNAAVGQGSQNIKPSHTVVTVCHKVKEETGCKSTPLAENIT